MNTVAIRSVAALAIVTGLSGTVQAQFRLRHIGARRGCYQPRAIDTRQIPRNSMLVPEKSIASQSTHSDSKSDSVQPPNQNTLQQEDTKGELSGSKTQKDSQGVESSDIRRDRRRRKRDRSKQDVDLSVSDQPESSQASSGGLNLGKLMEYFLRPNQPSKDEGTKGNVLEGNVPREGVTNDSVTNQDVTNRDPRQLDGRWRKEFREMDPNEFQPDGGKGFPMATPQEIPQRSELVCGSTVTVFTNFLQRNPGAVFLTVENVTIACQIVMWREHSVTFDLPAFGTNTARPAILRVVLPNGRVAKVLEILLVPAPTCVIHTESVGQPTFTERMRPVCEYAH